MSEILNRFDNNRSPTDTVNMKRRTDDKTLFKSKIIKDIENFKPLDKEFRDFFSKAINLYRLHCSTEPLTKTIDSSVEGYIYSGSNSIIQLKSSGNSSFLVLSTITSKKGTINFYFLNSNDNGVWYPLITSITLNLPTYIASKDPLDLIATQLYSSYHISNTNKTANWCKEVIDIVLSHLAFIGYSKENKTSVIDDLYSLHTGNPVSPSPEEEAIHSKERKFSKELLRLTPEVLISSGNEKEDTLINEMIEVENVLLKAGAKPKEDYTYLELMKEAKVNLKTKEGINE